MKKVLITNILLFIVSSMCFAGGNNKNAKLFSELASTIKTASQTYTQTGALFQRSTFTYNGKSINAFYNNEDGSLIGFSIHLSATDLPQSAQADIEKKYSGWEIKEAMMFITDSNVSYYASVSKPNKTTLALKIGGNNKAYIYAKM